MASTIVSRTQSGSESAAGRRTWTFSCWFKRCGISSSQELFGSDSNGARSNNYNIIDLNASDQIDFSGYESGTTFRKTTNRKFRDTNSWYHLVIAFDTTQSTADDRIKIYINGVRETSFNTSTNPSQDHQGKFFASNKIHAFGRSSQTFDGVISHCHATEGTAYAPTVFGSTDATTGEWKINTSPSVSYGTNGFFLFKDNNSVNNQAGNSSGNFTVSAGTLTKTEDCPSNVFATFNPLYRSSNTANFYNGNTRVTGTDYTNQRTGGTLASKSGKFYFEAKAVGSTDFGGSTVGIYNYDGTNIIMNSNTWFGSSSDYIGFYCSSNVLKVITNGSHDNHGSVSVGDIIGCAFDIDNGYLYLSINGTWVNSGVPTSGSTGTGNVNRTGSHNYDFSGLLMGIAGGFQVTDAWQCNFGNGYFSTTAVSSAGTNASGNGIFEYDVPTGYTALSTKGLNL